MPHPAEGAESVSDPRAILLAACERTRAAWKAADFSRAPVRYTEYLEACAALYEQDHPNPTDR